MIERKHIEAIEAAARMTFPAEPCHDPMCASCAEDRALLDAIHAALAAADESPWRSMDSVPKWDDVLLMLGDRMVVGYWHPTAACCIYANRPATASHWMPLPKAPAVKIVEANAGGES